MSDHAAGLRLAAWMLRNNPNRAEDPAATLERAADKLEADTQPADVARAAYLQAKKHPDGRDEPEAWWAAYHASVAHHDLRTRVARAATAAALAGQHVIYSDKPMTETDAATLRDALRDAAHLNPQVKP